jgi:hypothetical protein
MDVINASICIPHPFAENVLFKYKRETLNVFSDVIGLFEIDHLSICCINHNNEAIFLSHTPAIEYQLITSKLWPYDLMHEINFYKQEQHKLWSDLYHVDKYFQLNTIKQAKHGFLSGFSMAIKQESYYLIYSFATRSPEVNPQIFFLKKYSQLRKMGDYCFHQLSDILLSNVFLQSKSINCPAGKHLKLICHNQAQSNLCADLLEIS